MAVCSVARWAVWTAEWSAEPRAVCLATHAVEPTEVRWADLSGRRWVGSKVFHWAARKVAQTAVMWAETRAGDLAASWVLPRAGSMGVHSAEPTVQQLVGKRACHWAGHWVSGTAVRWAGLMAVRLGPLTAASKASPRAGRSADWTGDVTAD